MGMSGTMVPGWTMSSPAVVNRSSPGRMRKKRGLGEGILARGDCDKEQVMKNQIGVVTVHVVSLYQTGPAHTGSGMFARTVR